MRGRQRTETMRMKSLPEVLAAALALDSTERSELAHQLLVSLEPEDIAEDIDQAWAEEIRRRCDAIRKGEMPLRYWDEVLAEIRQSLAHKDLA